MYVIKHIKKALCTNQNIVRTFLPILEFESLRV
ncbi:MAG: hypothetical protein ACI9QV_000895 [Methylophagaceae bacterium]